MLKRFFCNINLKTYKYTENINRSNILVSGEEVIDILHNITTNDIKRFVDNEKLKSLDNLFLDTKGRILSDVIIAKNLRLINNKPKYMDKEFILNINKNKKSFLLKHLKLHSFKRKILIEDVSNYFKTSHIYNNWYDKYEKGVEGETENSFYDSESIKSLDENDIIDNLFYDPRDKDLGMFFIHNKENKIENIIEEIEYENPISFDLKRNLSNIFEGDEIYNQLPLPLNYDLKGTIKFNKGCYIGQELNARINFTGIIRKRACFYIVLKEKINMNEIWFNVQLLQLYNESINNFDLKVDNKFKSIYQKANMGICLFDYINEKDLIFKNKDLYYHIIIPKNLKNKMESYIKNKDSN